MSRAVAMLSGDIEVSAATSRPGYLTDWKFNDTTCFMSNETPTAKNEYSQYYSATISTNMMADSDHTPLKTTQSMLEEIIGEDEPETRVELRQLHVGPRRQAATSLGLRQPLLDLSRASTTTRGHPDAIDDQARPL
ncbi:hypothetical protein U1Q18_000101 [Sarracenia purpurea var. burkii]